MEIALVVLSILLVCVVLFAYWRSVDAKRVPLDLFNDLFEETGTSFEKKIQLMIDRTERSTSLRLEALGREAMLLHGEVSGLKQALRDTSAVGRWGEVQLRRVFELAGMVNHVDFIEQKTFTSGIDMGFKGARPDAVINLPNNRRIFIDAKTPLTAYLNAVDSTDEVSKTRFLAEHASAVRRNVNELAKKNYPAFQKEHGQHVLDFVLMFLPGDLFLAAAADSDPDLIVDAISRKVLLCTPSTLIAVLQTVEYGWRQEHLSEQLKDIQEEALVLNERMAVYFRHVTNMGKSLEKTVDAYNKSISSFELRLLPSIKRFQDVAKKSSTISPSPVEVAVHLASGDDEQEA